MTVRDFTLVFDSYVEFEESIIGSLMEGAAARLAPLVSKALDTTPENGLNINPDLRAGLNLLGLGGLHRASR
jgi:hypothetical protein